MGGWRAGGRGTLIWGALDRNGGSLAESEGSGCRAGIAGRSLACAERVFTPESPFPVLSATDDFNHGVVLSSRALRDGEVFQVRIDKMVDKWAGSIEIGVTTHDPAYLQLPSTMTNLRSGELPGRAGPGEGLREEAAPGALMLGPQLCLYRSRL